MDRSELNRKILFRLLAAPITLVPFMAGAMGLMAAWVFSLGLKVAFAFSIFSAVSVGAFFTRLLFGAEKVTKEAMEELEKEAAEGRQASLDELRNRLERDSDKRTEALLDDLMSITKSFTDGDTISGKINATSAFDIISGVEQLFNECVDLLNRTLVLFETAKKIHEDGAKKPLIDERESIIGEVRNSIAQLGSLLAGIQTMDLKNSNGSELDAIRQELDRNLSVAQRVEERMSSTGTRRKIHQ